MKMNKATWFVVLYNKVWQVIFVLKKRIHILVVVCFGMLEGIWNPLAPLAYPLDPPLTTLSSVQDTQTLCCTVSPKIKYW